MRCNRIFLVKFIHSIIFIFMSIYLLYIRYCAITMTYNWTLLVALIAIALNGLALLLNRGECPLTTLAKRYGDPKGSVTDILLPMFCARNVFRVSIALVTFELILLGLGYFTR